MIVNPTKGDLPLSPFRYCAVSASVIAVFSIFAFPSSAQAYFFPLDSDCKAKLDSVPPAGEHWFYHFGPNRNERCWYLRQLIGRSHNHSRIMQRSGRHESNHRAMRPSDNVPPSLGASQLNEIGRRTATIQDVLLGPRSLFTPGKRLTALSAFPDRRPDIENVAAQIGGGESSGFQTIPSIVLDDDPPGARTSSPVPKEAPAWPTIVMLMAAALAAAAVFRFARFFRREKQPYANEAPSHGWYAPVMEAKLVPASLQIGDSDARSDGRPACAGCSYSELDDSLAPFVPAKYRKVTDNVLNENGCAQIYGKAGTSGELEPCLALYVPAKYRGLAERKSRQTVPALLREIEVLLADLLIDSASSEAVPSTAAEVIK